MKIIEFIEKPLCEAVLFIVCLICIIPPTINHFFLLFKEIDIDILVIQYLSIAITISYLLTTIVYRLRKFIIIKYLTYLFLITLLFLFFFLKLLFGTNISPLIVMMIAETNTDESLEFLQNYALTKESILAIIYTIIIFLTVILIAKNIIKKYHKTIKHIIAILVIITFPISIYGIRIANSLAACKNMNEVSTWYDDYYPYAMDNISTLLYSLHIPHITTNEIESVIQRTKDALNNQAKTTEKDSMDVVFIIGESYIKYHAHIYGYSLSTTPIMDREKKKGNLYVFNDIISPYNSTTLAIKNILCTNSISDGELWSESIFFPAIFKQAGFNVYMWDNQKNIGTFLIYTFTINSLLYNKQIVDISYTRTNRTIYQYDGELLESLLTEKKEKHNFIIIHLMGQHVMASERYPSNFNYFNSNDIHRNEKYLNNEKKQMIAEYDNATLYNDSVMGIIFNHYRNKNAIVVMLSDHGEEIYDIRNAKGRNYDHNNEKRIIKYQNDIPLIIWCSEKYIYKNPNIINDIKKSVNKKGMSDNICQLLFRIAHINTPIYKADNDIISSKYQKKKRIIYDKMNYDKIQ